jgi:hypothetical protein
MAEFKIVEKKAKLEYWDLVKFQILTYCYLEKVAVSESDLDCLTFLALSGEEELTVFCTRCAERGIFSSAQTVRNALTKAEKKNLIVKDGKAKKKIALNPELRVFSEGNVLLDYKFAALAPSKEI